MLPEDSLAAALYGYLVDHVYGEPPERRRHSGWVMNTEWLAECRRLAAALGNEVMADGQLQSMLGMPLLPAREDGGVPHLEVID